MRFLVAIHHPDDYDPFTQEDAAMHDAIDALNARMVAAGARVFVGGLRPAREAKSVRATQDGGTQVSDGPYLPTREHVGGFWVLDCASLDDALAWAHQAATACRAPVEVREFW